MALNILLASASPRRKQLLEQLAYTVQQCAADINEQAYQGEEPSEYALRMAKEKASCVALSRPEAIIIAADTIITIDGQIIGKPQSYQHACEIWQLLANRQHQVITAVALHYQGQQFTAINHNEVVFAAMTATEMQQYWASGEPQDKAGAYAVQGLAAQWIKQINGSYSGIMGLPLYECKQLLEQAGLV